MRKLLQMLSAVSMLVCTGQFDAFGSPCVKDDLGDKAGKQVVIAKTEHLIPGPINDIPPQGMLIILEEISKVINPRHLTSVCKAWENDFGLKNELYYTDMGQFMQRCMDIFWTNQSYTKQFYNGVLRYAPPQYGQVVTLPFSSLQDGTFDLSTCGNRGQYLVITTSMDRFFKVEEENKSKTVILIMLRHEAEKRINQSHPFSVLMAGWDADKAPVGIFWRQGNNKNLTKIDYLTTASLSDISNLSFYKNWQKSSSWSPGARVSEWWMEVVSSLFHVNFLSRNEDY